MNKLASRVVDPDPGSGAFWPLDSGWEKNSGFGSGIRIHDQHPKSFFLFYFIISFYFFLAPKKLKFCDSDPGSGIFLTLDPGWKIRILDPGCFGSGINIPDPQHCWRLIYLRVFFSHFMNLMSAGNSTINCSMSNTIIHYRIPSVMLLWNSIWTFIFNNVQADIEEIMTSREEEIKACNPPFISTHLEGFSNFPDGVCTGTLINN